MSILVTVRGDALGVLAVTLPGRGADPDADTVPEGALDPATDTQLTAVAHARGYVLIANQRHTDTYETAMRSAEFTLPREIQRRLLPPGFVCEGGSFTVAGWLEPSASAAGDSFDYVASSDRLTVSLTHASGHDLRAAMTAGQSGVHEFLDQAGTGGLAITTHPDSAAWSSTALRKTVLPDPRSPVTRVAREGCPDPRRVRRPWLRARGRGRPVQAD